MNHYISDHENVLDSCNDAIPIKYDQAHFDLIKEELPDISDRLAAHVARLFARDPVPAYEGEFIEDQIDDEHWTLHFENL